MKDKNLLTTSPKYVEDVTMLIGNTPLLKLNKIFEQHHVFAKLEYYNPTFSVKDRAAFHMVEKAMSEKKIAKGHTIIGATSGNTGLGLCLAANYFELNYICVAFDTVPKEKISLLKALGAIVVMCDSEAESYEEGGYVWVAKQLAKEIDNSYLVDQFVDINNPSIHYLKTGPEIWNQMDGQIDYFFSTIGTGGTISGIGKYLKEKDSNIKVIGVEPNGGIYRKVFKNLPPIFETHLINSISDCFISPNLDFNVIDDIISIDDNEAFKMCYSLLQKESICVGTSSGCVLKGIEEYLEKANYTGKRERIVTVLPDIGLKYMDTLFNPDYLKTKQIIIGRDNKHDCTLNNLVEERFGKYNVKVDD